ncbi:MAG: YlbF family regulator [Sporolactobacillus sp.]
MSGYSKEDVLNEARAMAEQMAELDEVQAYKQAEAKISANKKVDKLIDQIKYLQKESVNLAHFQKHEAYRKNEAKIDALQAELDAIPVVQAFKQLQAETNDLLQQTTELITNKVNESLEKLPDLGKK